MTVRETHSKPDSDLYAADMVKRMMLGVQEFRTYLKVRVAAVEAGEHTVLARRGKPVAVLVPIDWYRRVSALDNDPTEF